MFGDNRPPDGVDSAIRPPDYRHQAPRTHGLHQFGMTTARSHIAGENELVLPILMRSILHGFSIPNQSDQGCANGGNCGWMTADFRW
jgi:hypothetical protein